MEPAGLIRNYSSFELVGHFSTGISGLSSESRHRSCKNRNLIPRPVRKRERAAKRPMFDLDVAQCWQDSIAA
jgi:hypothetical protein